ncbi:hypothetical protein OIU77_025406 [Salix suchowensis]|uniref:Uncharacterized protein n=1 Tax=Salix suchowensis TaxID=1278906 RepID=A0ABQ9BW60_9ROSI|nr:hypothetical protein OIU77_025406 [Salix suchowensis]
MYLPYCTSKARQGKTLNHLAQPVPKITRKLLKPPKPRALMRFLISKNSTIHNATRWILLKNDFQKIL